MPDRHVPVHDDEPRVPRRERIPPIQSMAQTLVDLRADLGDECACAEALSGRHFFASDIAAFLEAAIERAREMKARSDTTFCIVRDLAAVAIFLMAVFLWSLPARAAASDALLATESELKLVWWTVLAVGVVGILFGGALLCVSISRRRPS